MREGGSEGGSEQVREGVREGVSEVLFRTYQKVNSYQKVFT